MRIERKLNKTKAIITDQLMYIEHDDHGFLFEVFKKDGDLPYMEMWV